MAPNETRESWMAPNETPMAPSETPNETHPSEREPRGGWHRVRRARVAPLADLLRVFANWLIEGSGLFPSCYHEAETFIPPW